MDLVIWIEMFPDLCYELGGYNLLAQHIKFAFRINSVYTSEASNIDGRDWLGVIILYMLIHQ